MASSRASTTRTLAGSANLSNPARLFFFATICYNMGDMTPERMTWETDEGLYQPRIHSERIRELHQISKELGEPMTVLVDQALGQFIERYRQMCHDEWTDAIGAGAGPPTEPRSVVIGSYRE